MKMDTQDVILYPLMGEKATMLREKENKLSFIVNRNAGKEEIKKAIETVYNVKIIGMQSMITSEGQKKVHAKLDSKYSAEEIASHFGVL